MCVCVHSRFRVSSPIRTIAHCNHSHDYSTGAAVSYILIAIGILPFQNVKHMSDCSVQCVNGTSNAETTV